MGELSESEMVTSKSNVSGNERRHGPLINDEFSIMPTSLVAILFILETALFYKPITSFFFAFPIVLSVPIIAAFFLYRGIKHGFQGHYKSAASTILAIPLLVLALGFPIKDGVQNAYAFKSARYIKLFLNERQYFEEIKLVKPDVSGYRYKEFSWGEFGGTCYTLVYDESDEMGQPHDPSKIWRERDWPTGESDNVKSQYTVQKMRSHFYVVNFVCA